MLNAQITTKSTISELREAVFILESLEREDPLSGYMDLIKEVLAKSTVSSNTDEVVSCGCSQSCSVDKDTFLGIKCG